MRAQARRHVRGVSLIEALVALAVMGFGILAIFGMQLTLRNTGDMSKQRAEAVRIAQATLESARAYSVLDTTSGQKAYADIQDQPATEFVGPATNTTFTVTIDTVDHFTSPTAPRSKAAALTVAWPDRTGAAQAIALRSLIAGVPPELAGTLAVPGERSPGERARGGRHVALPRMAIDQGDGTSHFSPPGGETVVWVFDNLTGDILSICTLTPGTCTDTHALLLAGFIRFATGDPPAQPTGADAEVPPSPAFPVTVQVDATAPVATTVPCYTDTTPSYVAYYCAMPVPVDPPSQWSGRARLEGFTIATTLADASLSAYRVCRYTPVQSHTPPGGNAAHPLDYVDVTTPLTNQNYLVIRAGNGSTAFDCPADDTSTPLVNGTTWRHQPSD